MLEGFIVSKGDGNRIPVETWLPFLLCIQLEDTSDEATPDAAAKAYEATSPFHSM